MVAIRGLGEGLHSPSESLPSPNASSWLYNVSDFMAKLENMMAASSKKVKSVSVDLAPSFPLDFYNFDCNSFDSL